MASAGSSKWLAFGGAILIAAIAADSLVPVAWQVRSGLHWLTEHFLAYLAATSIFCLALQRPVIVVGVAMALAALMEGLQGLTADRIPDLLTALSGVAGALAGALLAILLTKLLERRKAPLRWVETNRN
jgi:VanZ family protein